MKKKLLSALFLMATGLYGFAQLPEGKKAYDREKYQTATRLLEEAATANPADLSNWYWLQRSYYANDHTDSAALLIGRVPSAQQEAPLFHVMKGAVALHRADSATALSEFAAALGNNRKKDPATQLAIAQTVTDAENGNLRYAISLLEEAASRDSKNPDIFLAMGDVYRKLYNGSDAFRNYTRAVELDKNNPVPYYKIGKIYQTQQNEQVYQEYYDKALALDPQFAPVYFQKYYGAYFKDVNKAMEPLVTYVRLADPDIKNTYLLADLFYILKKYPDAIGEAKKIITNGREKINPRLYKLLAYSYEGIKDSVASENSLTKYFSVAADSAVAADDQLLMARLLEKRGEDSLASLWRAGAFAREKDPKRKIEQARKIVALAKARKNYTRQAEWYRELEKLQAPLTNVELFSWGVANYNAQKYGAADSVFARYQEKYPEQTFGYYWRARSNAAIDTAMELGLAIPHYENLIKVAEKDTANANNRKWLIQAYGYIAAYKVNTQKQYDEALTYYDKILTLDPGNDDAEKYKDVLGKMIERQEKQHEKENSMTKEKNSPPGN